MTGGDDELVEVRVLGIPLALYREASQHHDELRREFALILSAADAGHDGEVPARLLSLIRDLELRFQGFTAEPRRRLIEAAAGGGGSLDLVYRVPAAAGPAAAELDALLDEADEYCRAGQTLLTLATPPEALGFRRWFLAEFVRQTGGEPPRPWEG